jgi:hypothetical protein
LPAEGLCRTGAHSSTQDNLAVAEQSGNAGMAVSGISHPRFVSGWAVLADAQRMRGLLVGAQLAVLDGAAFDFKNDESGTLAKMLGDGYPIHCRHCYFHVHPLIPCNFNFALVCSSGTSAAVLPGYSSG